MRAITITNFGSPEVLTVLELPVPEPGKGEVRLRVRGASVHPLDLVARAGYLGPMLPQGPTYVLGADVAGTVDAVGPGVDAFEPGQLVIGMSNWPDTKTGTQAEYVVLPADVLAAAPSNGTAEAAATLPLNAHTASQALGILNLERGQTVAVTGAAGGVGCFAVELAMHRGLKVFAIASSSDEEFLVGRGAEFVMRAENIPAAVRAKVPDGVDGLLDTASVGAAAMGAVRDGGSFVAVTPPTPPSTERGIRVGLVLARANGAELAELAGLVEKEVLSLRLGRTYSFDQVAEAHSAKFAGGVRGGIVLVPSAGGTR